MTVIRPNSISGITSITGFGGDIKIFRADGTAADVTVNNITSGVITATHYGSGANLTNLPAANLTGTLPAISAANLTSIPAANITGTLPAISAANLTNVPAANITGALPAIDGSALTGVGVGTADSINTSGIITATAFVSSQGQLSHRNKARNGAMKISQRGTTFSPTTSEMYLIDGWITQHGSSGNLDCTVTQSTDAPVGFSKSLKITPDSTNTPSGSQNGMLAQRLEGQELQDFAFGTSDAKTITVSWYAKTSATGAGNYTVKVEYSVDGSQGNVYAVNKLFAFTTTWTRYTYTIPATGTATSVGIVDSNAFGFRVEYHLFSGPDDVHSQLTQWTSNPSPTYKVISGQKNFMDNTNNELYITGLQIEVGSVATPFEHRSHGEELRRCQRYYQKDLSRNRRFWGSGNVSGRQFPVRFDVEMRDTPSVSFPSTSIDSGSFSANGINRQGYYTNMSGSGRFYEWQHIANAEI